jgi:hypothetical protein
MDSHTTLNVGVNTSAQLAWLHLVAPLPVMLKTLQHLLPNQHSRLPLQHLLPKIHLMKNQQPQPHQSQRPNQVAMLKTSWP